MLKVADDPETLRIKQNTKHISNVAYHGDLEKKAAMEKQREVAEVAENRGKRERWPLWTNKQINNQTTIIFIVVHPKFQHIFSLHKHFTFITTPPLCTHTVCKQPFFFFAQAVLHYLLLLVFGSNVMLINGHFSFFFFVSV